MTNTWFDIQKANLKENDELINIFDDEPMQSYQLSTIYEFYECRNSYNASSSRVSMFNNFGFHFNFDVIKQRIEANRKMGSYFEIHEVPCIAIKGENKALVLFPKTSNQFLLKSLEKKLLSIENRSDYFIYEETTLINYYDLLKSLGHALNFFVTDTENIASLEMPLRAYKSVSEGSDYYLTYKFWHYSIYACNSILEDLIKSFTLLDSKTKLKYTSYY